jgi:hypothetical protein
MAVGRLVISNATALALSIASSYAGPCTPEIGRMRAGIGAWLASGPSAPQSVAAMLHHQPTPSSVAAAEERLATISARAIAALAQRYEGRPPPARRARAHCGGRT